MTAESQKPLSPELHPSASTCFTPFLSGVFGGRSTYSMMEITLTAPTTQSISKQDGW